MLEVIREQYLIGISSEKEILIWDIFNFRNVRNIQDDEMPLSVSVLVLDQDSYFLTRYATNKIKKWNFADLQTDVITQVCHNLFPNGQKISKIKFMSNKTIGILACKYSLKILNTKTFTASDFIDFYTLPFSFIFVESFEIIEDKYVAVSLEIGTLNIYDSSGIAKKQLQFKIIHEMKYSNNGYLVLITDGSNGYNLEVWKCTQLNFNRIWSSEEYSLINRIELINSNLFLIVKNNRKLRYNYFSSHEKSLEIQTELDYLNDVKLIKSLETNISNIEFNETLYNLTDLMINVHFETQKIDHLLTDVVSSTIVDDSIYILRDVNFEEYYAKLKLNLDLNDCISNCSNHGNCNTNLNEYKCSCQANYTGSKCDLDIRPCSSNPCINKGSCFNSPNMKDFKCVCYKKENKSSLFYGRHCEFKIDVCQNETCSSQGYCYANQDEPKCKCHFGFFGDKCENKQDFLITYQIVKKTFVTITIAILVSFYVLCILNDLADYFCNLKVTLKDKHKEKLEKKQKKQKKKNKKNKQ